MPLHALFLLLLFQASAAPDPKADSIFQLRPVFQLLYDRPARAFEESLPLGNGQVGASVYGDPYREKIHLNDATLWSGRPVNARMNALMNPEAFRHLPAVRAALAAEDWPLAEELVRKLQGLFSQSYAPLGDLTIEMTHGETSGGYERRLDLATATASVRYEAAGSSYERRYFVSHPDRVFVIRLTGTAPRSLGFRLGFSSLLRYAVDASSHTLVARGEAPVHAEPSYRGDMERAIIYDEGKGTRFVVLARIAETDGHVTGTGGTLELSGATRAIIIVSIATSFSGFDREPGLDGRNEIAIAQAQLDAASRWDLPTLHARHVTDFAGFFDRVALDLGPDPAPGLTTDARLKRYTEGAADPYLEALYFQFGRYLLISSSRTPGVPANLQGIWNPHMRPPWSSNYTTNINAQMNYWPAEVTNLAEMHEPMLGFIENLAVTGRVTAETFWGTRGWSVAHNSDIWAMSNPVGDFGKGDPAWANWQMGGVWLATHLWEHWLFSRDETYLRERAWPLLVGAAEFALDWLIDGPDGYLVTAPSTSPENTYVTPDGFDGATSIATTGDMAMIRELFTAVLEAADLVGGDEAFVRQVREARDRLVPYRIGRKGNLQEWYWDWEESDPQHRHQTHLFGLYPGSQIDPRRTPELAGAARTTLEIKGDESTGWSKAWRINLWARLLDGNRAHKLFRELLTFVDPVTPVGYSRGGGTYPNLFDAHPPFQIDGNFGGTAGVAEMLVQSHAGEIAILPALPDAWPTGSVRGLRARGGLTVDLVWERGALTSATLTASVAGEFRVVYRDREAVLSLGAGESAALGNDLERR